jgi:hypothetical protein
MPAAKSHMKSQRGHERGTTEMTIAGKRTSGSTAVQSPDGEDAAVRVSAVLVAMLL